MESNEAPPMKDGGNAKYAVIGLVLLLGGGGAIYKLTRPSDTPAPPRPTAVVDAGIPQLPIATPQVGDQIELPPEQPDAGPTAVVADGGPPRIRYVTRYVAACPGTVDVNQVQRVAQLNYGSMRACYERELRSDNTLRGPLTAQLKINTAGRIEEVQVSTPMRSRALVECVKTALRRLSVPPSRGGCALAQVRFNFTPSN